MGRRQTLQESLPSLWRILRHLRPYLRPQRWLLAGSLLALLAEVGLRALEPWPLKFVFDHLLRGPHSSSPLPLVGALEPLTLLTLAALAVVVFTSLRALAAYLNTIGFALLGSRVLAEVRNKLYHHLQCLSLSFHNQARSGDLLVRVTSDTAQLQEIAVTALLPLLGNIFILVGMLGLMFSLHWRLALLTLVVLPLFWVTTTRSSKRIHEAARRQRQREGALAATAAESIGAIKIVQALSLQGTFARTFSSHNSKSLKEGVKTRRLAANLERTTDVIIAIATALVLWYGTWLALREELTPGDLLVFLSYLKSAFKPMQDLAKYTGRLAKAAAAGERVMALLEREPEVRNWPGAISAYAFRGAVSFQDVSFAYEPGRWVLKEVSFEVHPGQYIALVGPSGHGKSTLASLILRLYDPTTGSVMIDGRDIRHYTLDCLRSQISVLLQDGLLFAASVRDNIAYGAPAASLEEIVAAARLANAHQFIAALPEGYDTVIGERGVTLSHGQRQRLAIARAAIRQAPILILDEPTTGLDGENERAVVEALDRLTQGRTTFLITHTLLHAAKADLILYLEDGRVRESGTHHELMRANGRYAALYRLQASACEYGRRAAASQGGGASCYYPPMPA